MKFFINILFLAGILLFSGQNASAATFNVQNANDDLDPGTCGPCLRNAINSVNLNAPPNDIRFNIPGAGPHTINLVAPLPVITQAVTIDGYTQPGAIPNTLAAGTNAVILIELDGTSAGFAHGLQIDQGPTTIRGLVIHSFGGDGIFINFGANNITIEGNFLGTDPTGSIDLGNSNNGIAMGFSNGSVIGGNTPAARNLISGNFFGFQTGSATNTIIQGNLIGTDASGTLSLGNDAGGSFGGDNNILGGTSAAERNVISGNNGFGMVLFQNADNNLIQGNFIGTDVTGLNPLPNQGSGIEIAGANNTIGGTIAGAGNTIAFNTADGVLVASLSLITPGTGNAIWGNSIFSNGDLGIELFLGAGGFGNNNQAAPVLTSAVSTCAGTTIVGTLNSSPTTNYRIEFFSNPSGSPDEGKTFIGTIIPPLMTDGGGVGAINVFLPGVVIPAGQFITATATDLSTNINDTSEFSNSQAVTGVNPGALQFSSPTYNVNENDGTATITVSRIGGSECVASVNFATSDGTAVADVDYTPSNGTLNWADGDGTDKTFPVTILDDTLVEGDETVNLTLSNPTGVVSLGDPIQAVLTILANDNPPSPPPPVSPFAASGGGCQMGPSLGGNYLFSFLFISLVAGWLMLRRFSRNP